MVIGSLLNYIDHRRTGLLFRYWRARHASPLLFYLCIARSAAVVCSKRMASQRLVLRMVSSFVKSPSQSAYNKSEGNDFLGSRYEVRGAAFSLVTRDSSLVIGCVVKSVGKVFCNTARLACHHQRKLRVSASLSELRMGDEAGDLLFICIYWCPVNLFS